MLRDFLKGFVSLIIVLHCIGVTQLMSSYAKDKSVFAGMLNMTEEETKKESNSKEDTDNFKDTKTRHNFFLVSPFLEERHLYILESKFVIADQFISDNPTPPPDSLS